MKKYLVSRILAMLITLFAIMTIAFVVVRLMPGSVYDNPDLPPEVVAILEERAHLNEPLIVQYGYFLKGILLENDWGTSVRVEPGVPAFDVLRTKIPVSLSVNLTALILAIPVGIVFGTIAAVRKNHVADHFISFWVVIFISVPSFVFASVLQYFLAFRWEWFPLIYESTGGLGLQIYSMVLPVLALSFSSIATVTRYLRGELIETMGSEFMVLARTKGLTQTQAIARHAFRNSCLPLTNVVIPMFANVMGGSLVIERIFSIPGVGNVMIDSINTNDYSLAVAALIFYSIISLVTMLIVDITYGLIDPRIRLGGK